MKLENTNSYKGSLLAGLSETDILNLKNISIVSAKKGGDLLMKHYGKLKSIDSKATEGDLVTNADIASEEIILDNLAKSTPDISVLAEESGAIGSSNGLKWVVDPLDGTTNFAHGYPFFATSIGLTWNNIPILGCIDIPFIKETYFCSPYEGSFCNSNKIRASKCSKLSDSLLITGFAYDRKENINNNYAEFCWLTHRTRGVRRGGAAAVDLAFLANGRADGYWERGLSQWDLVAGVVIAELAGCEISDYSGGEFDLNSGRIIASTPGIKAELTSVLKKVKPLNGEMFGAPELTTH